MSRRNRDTKPVEGVDADAESAEVLLYVRGRDRFGRPRTALILHADDPAIANLDPDDRDVIRALLPRAAVEREKGGG